MSSTSTYSSLRTSFSSESDSPGVSDLSFHCKAGGVLREFWRLNEAAAISGTRQFSMLLASVRRTLAWPVFTPPCQEAEGGIR